MLDYRLFASYTFQVLVSFHLCSSGTISALYMSMHCMSVYASVMDMLLDMELQSVQGIVYTTPGNDSLPPMSACLSVITAQQAKQCLAYPGNVGYGSALSWSEISRSDGTGGHTFKNDAGQPLAEKSFCTRFKSENRSWCKCRSHG